MMDDKPKLRAVDDENDCLDINDEWIPDGALFSYFFPRT